MAYHNFPNDAFQRAEKAVPFQGVLGSERAALIAHAYMPMRRSGGRDSLVSGLQPTLRAFKDVNVGQVLFSNQHKSGCVWNYSCEHTNLT